MENNNSFIAFENEVSKVDIFGCIHWKHRQLVESLMPVAKLELPKDLWQYLYSDKFKIDPEHE